MCLLLCLANYKRFYFNIVKHIAEITLLKDIFRDKVYRKTHCSTCSFFSSFIFSQDFKDTTNVNILKYKKIYFLKEIEVDSLYLKRVNNIKKKKPLRYDTKFMVSDNSWAVYTRRMHSRKDFAIIQPSLSNPQEILFGLLEPFSLQIKYR